MNVLSKFTVLMKLQDILVNKGFERESSVTMELFGLLNKSSFKAKLSTISQFQSHCYTDKETMMANLPITNLTCARSMGALDPMISIKASYEMPDIKLKLRGSKSVAFDSDSYKATVTVYDNNSSKTTTKSMTYLEIINNLVEKFDQQHILTYCRKYYTNQTSKTPVMYFNEINWLVDALATINNKFIADVSEIHTALKVTNFLNNWEQKVYVDVLARPIQYESLDFNIVIHSLISSYLATPDLVKWDPQIQA